jgi:hydroxymethylglutaryl-CoA synthase
MSALAVAAAAGVMASEAAKRFLSSTGGAPSTEGKKVGILAIEVYSPATYIAQSDLEEHCGVPPGKFTIGLGQEGLGFCGDAEDVNSLALTAVHSLLEK